MRVMNNVVVSRQTVINFCTHCTHLASLSLSERERQAPTLRTACVLLQKGEETGWKKKKK